jgi:hypothetical protein
MLAIALLVVVIGASGCRPSDGSQMNPSPPTAVEEAAVRPLPLGAPLDDPRIEISGLAWHGDTLVILPQYTSLEAPNNQHRLWGLPRAAIDRFLQDTTAAPLDPFPIRVDARSVASYTGSYEGCEAIAFRGDTLYIVTESGTSGADGMTGHLLRGRVAPGLDRIEIEGTSVQKLPRQTGLANMSYEALLVNADTLIALHEANGAAVNTRPRAHRFDPALRPLDPVTFPTLEYRLTDATAVDEAGRFWVTNFFFPGERELLQPATDSVALRHGTGASHVRSPVVERLVEYQIVNGGIRRTDRPPIWLQLGENTGRNWEGIVRYRDGFLLATDRFPKTILAYVDGGR